MTNPVYAYKEKNGKAIAVFSSGIDIGYRNVVQKTISQVAKRYLGLLKIVPQMPGQKTAVVLMVKGKEEVEKQNE